MSGKKMLYRPRSNDRWFKKQQIVKTASMGINLDAIVVEKGKAGEYKGWFDHPSKLLPKKEPKQPKVKANDNSVKVDQ